ncbi:MAG TPA: signal peptidase I [Actinomycetota bacterium]|jgi:signal peptidase I
MASDDRTTELTTAPPADGTSVEGDASRTQETAPTAPVPDEAEPRRKRKKRRGLVGYLTELPILILLAFVIAIVIKTFLLQAFYIPSGSMLPALHVGDRVLVEKLSYRFHGPERGDVVVFENSVFGATEPPDLAWYDDAKNFARELLGLPTGTEEDYIKRVVAVGGDTIRYVGNPRHLVVNGEMVDEPYVNHGKDPTSQTLTSGDCERLDMDAERDTCVVPAGQIFVMGDNRANSQDSRFLGPVDEDKVVGRAFVIIWPAGDFGWI